MIKKSILAIAIFLTAPIIARLEITQPVFAALAEAVPKICEQKLVTMPPEGCGRRQVGRLNSVVARSVRVSTELEERKKLLEADIATQEMRSGRNKTLIAELKRLRTDCVSVSDCRGIVWRQKLYANSAELDLQRDALVQEGERTRSALEKLRKLHVDLDQQRVIVLDVRSRAAVEAQLLSHQIALLAVGALVDELRDAMEHAVQLVVDAERKLDEVSTSGALRSQDDLDPVGKRPNHE
jgi:hypothetical protein